MGIFTGIADRIPGGRTRRTPAIEPPESDFGGFAMDRPSLAPEFRVPDIDQPEREETRKRVTSLGDLIEREADRNPDASVWDIAERALERQEKEIDPADKAARDQFQREKEALASVRGFLSGLPGGPTTEIDKMRAKGEKPTASGVMGKIAPEVAGLLRAIMPRVAGFTAGGLVGGVGAGQLAEGLELARDEQIAALARGEDISVAKGFSNLLDSGRLKGIDRTQAENIIELSNRLAVTGIFDWVAPGLAGRLFRQGKTAVKEAGKEAIKRGESSIREALKGEAAKQAVKQFGFNSTADFAGAAATAAATLSQQGIDPDDPEFGKSLVIATLMQTGVTGTQATLGIAGARGRFRRGDEREGIAELRARNLLLESDVDVVRPEALEAQRLDAVERLRDIRRRLQASEFTREKDRQAIASTLGITGREGVEELRELQFRAREESIRLGREEEAAKRRGDDFNAGRLRKQSFRQHEMASIYQEEIAKRTKTEALMGEAIAAIDQPPVPETMDKFAKNVATQNRILESAEANNGVPTRKAVEEVFGRDHPFRSAEQREVLAEDVRNGNLPEPDDDFDELFAASMADLHAKAREQELKGFVGKSKPQIIEDLQTQKQVSRQVKSESRVVVDGVNDRPMGDSVIPPGENGFAEMPSDQPFMLQAKNERLTQARQWLGLNEDLPSPITVKNDEVVKLAINKGYDQRQSAMNQAREILESDTKFTGKPKVMASDEGQMGMLLALGDVMNDVSQIKSRMAEADLLPDERITMEGQLRELGQMGLELTDALNLMGSEAARVMVRRKAFSLDIPYDREFLEARARQAAQQNPKSKTGDLNAKQKKKLDKTIKDIEKTDADVNKAKDKQIDEDMKRVMDDQKERGKKIPKKKRQAMLDENLKLINNLLSKGCKF